MVKRQNKGIGQVFLHDTQVIDDIISFSQIDSDDVVVEIGCGKGILSKALAATAKHLTIFELDGYYLDHTESVLKKKHSNVTYVQGDIRDAQFDQILSDKARIVANIPYHISTEIIELIIKQRSHILDATLMVQKEYADRVLATPGTKSYGSLSIFAQFFLEVSPCFDVSRHSFYPVPKVDSTVIYLAPRDTVLFDVDERLFFNIVHAAFWGRRKTLLNCLQKSPYTQLPPEIRQIPFYCLTYTFLK